MDDGERTCGLPDEWAKQPKGAAVGTPDDIDVWIGLDIGKAEHFADVLDGAGSPLFSAAVTNDEADVEALLDRAASFGVPALVVDQPGSLASLVLAVAARRDVPVAYVPGLVMRRAADLYPGEAKTDRRDAFVLADTGRTRRPPGALARRPRRRAARATARPQRLRRRPCSRRHTALEPAS